MKKKILAIAIAIILFPSCQKEKCKAQQIEDMKNMQIELQKELSNTNLTVAQIEAIKARFDAKQKEIMAECD